MKNLTKRPENSTDNKSFMGLENLSEAIFPNVQDSNRLQSKKFMLCVKRSIREIDDHLKGEIKLRSAYDVLNEL